MTKARDIADFKFENIVDTGTEGTKVASGTTAQRGSTAGQFRFNSTTGLAEYYDGTNFKSIDAPPTVSSISPTTETDANANIVITGTNFASGATVKFVGADNTEYTSPSVTVNSSTQITATTPATPLTVANEPYDIKVTNTSGLSAILADALDAGSSPTWTTASGSLGNVYEGSTANFSVSATDPDGDTVSYSETTSVLSGAGFSLNSSTGAITGTASNVSGDTTNTFTLRASDGTNTTDRSFSIITKNTLEKDSNTLAFFDFANSGRSFTSGSTTATDLSGRGKNLPFGSAFHSSTLGTLEGSSTQNTRATGLIGSISEVSMGVWVKLDGNTNRGVIYYGDTSTNNHFFVRDGIGGTAYNFDVGKDINGSDNWAKSQYNGSNMSNYITGVSGYASKYWYYVVRINSSGLVTTSLNKSTFETTVSTGVNMSGHSSGQFGLFGDPYNDNASSHSIGVAWWYNGVVSQALSDSVYDQYASRFGY